MMPDFETRFAEALLDPALPLPGGLTTIAGYAPEQRFDVYRNNVRAGLAGALASRFPAAVRITGEAFFRMMALDYALKHPPASALLMTYGEDFPAFAAGYEPAAGLPYLADVMRIDLLRGRAYHAADAVPLAAAALAAVPAEDVGHLRFALHPSLGILRSPHPAFTIWAMNSGERALGAITAWEGEDVLVIRPELELRVISLPAGGAAFLLALGKGLDLASAVEAAVDDNTEFDLEKNLGGALAHGVFAGLHQGDTP